MSKKSPTEQAKSLIGACTPSNLESTEREYSLMLAKGAAEGQLDAISRDALSAAWPLLHSWMSRADLPADTALREWLQLRRAHTGRSVAPIFEELVKKLPAAGRTDIEWRSILLGDTSREQLEILTARKILKASDILKIARAQPEAFYCSPALDVLIELGKPAPRATWEALAKGDPRPPEQNNGEGLLASSFANDQGADAALWLIRFLAKHESIRPPVLKDILRDAPALLRLGHALATVGISRSGARRKKEQVAIALVISDLLPLCESAIAERRRTSTAAAALVGVLVASISAVPACLPDETARSLFGFTSRVIVPLVAHDAAVGERSTMESGGLSLACLSVSDLQGVVEKYLDQLPDDRSSEAPEDRASRYARYAGRREVVESLLPLLYNIPSRDREHELVEAALFNAGVRPLGDVDEVVAFDEFLHQPVGQPALPSELVSIESPGWVLGSGQARIVMVKARVRRKNS